MISKNEFIHQYKTKQGEIKIQKEKIARLQFEKIENENAIKLLNKFSHTTLVDKVPLALEIAKINASSIENLNSEDKPAVWLYIHEQMNLLGNKEKNYKEQLEITLKLDRLLEKIKEHLTSGYDKKIIAEIANQSGITSTKLPQNTGFDLLLELLGEDKSQYPWWTFDFIDKNNLTNAVTRKINSIKDFDREEEKRLKEFSSAINALEQLKLILEKNYDHRDILIKRSNQLAERINQIKTVTIKKLSEEKKELDRQIKILNEQENVQKLKREQELALEERGELAKTIKEMLINYINDRNSRFYLKDLFISEDKYSREHFIDELINEKDGLIKKYKETGNTEELLKKIVKDIDNFPGIKMQSTLNRIIIKLIEAEEQSLEVENLPEEAQKILSAFIEKEENYKEYALIMQNLYAKIESFKTFADTLPELEKEQIYKLQNDLKKDIDRFVYQNSQEIPGKEFYQKFKMKIKARLHSQDDVMSGYSYWPVTIANILLSIVTLGKLIYSKATNKRASPFFDKVEDQKEIETTIDNTLDDIEGVLKV